MRAARIASVPEETPIASRTSRYAASSRSSASTSSHYEPLASHTRAIAAGSHRERPVLRLEIEERHRAVGILIDDDFRSGEERVSFRASSPLPELTSLRSFYLVAGVG